MYSYIYIYAIQHFSESNSIWNSNMAKSIFFTRLLFDLGICRCIISYKLIYIGFSAFRIPIILLYIARENRLRKPSTARIGDVVGRYDRFRKSVLLQEYRNTYSIISIAFVKITITAADRGI